jgi:hypothetical protein
MMDEIATSVAVILLPAVMLLLRSLITKHVEESVHTPSFLLKDTKGHKVEIVFSSESTEQERSELVNSKVQELMKLRTA